MLRLTRRVAQLFSIYDATLLAVVVAGFLGAAVGIWASLLWGVAAIAAVYLYMRQRTERRAPAK